MSDSIPHGGDRRIPDETTRPTRLGKARAAAAVAIGQPQAIAIATLQRDLINRYQGGFPLVPRPFKEIAAKLDSDEDNLLALTRALLQQGLLSRFGPLYNAERLGGCFTLAAMAVPERDFERVTLLLNAIPEVAHNYRRDHALNMWFVLATPDVDQLHRNLEHIQSQTGLRVLDFPKLKEYHLGFWLRLDADGGVGVRRVEPAHPGRTLDLDLLDRAIIGATQAGLPLVAEPFAAVAATIGCDAPTLMARLRRMLRAGAIRRIGAVPNHYRLGLRGNGMSVWDVDDRQVDALGKRIGALDFVSHCYLRPRRPPLWPYNLFAMIHGRDPDQVRRTTASVEALVAGHCRNHALLFSEAILKKTGLRFAH